MRGTLTVILMFVAMCINAQSLQFTLSVENTWNKPKKDEPVIVKLNEIKGLNFMVSSAGVTLNGHAIPYQLDDMNGDERADELVFLVNINKKEKQVYNIELRNGKTPGDRYIPRVYADMQLDDKNSKYPYITSLEASGESYLYNDLYHHGVEFESEYTAFRVYFDQRQNIDIYGKKLYRLELANTHFYTTSEQIKQDYGNDVLWVGNSVGCGSFKGWDGKATTDIEPVKTRGQKLIAAGPLRTVLEIKDLGWKDLNMKQYYILYAGHRECEVHVIFDELLTTDTFSTGVQKVGSNPEGFLHNDGIAASWGSDYPEMGKKEKFPPETVGLAVYVPVSYIKYTKESGLNYLFILNASGQNEIYYYVSFCADKEQNGYHNAKDWFESLKYWKSNLDNPISVKIETKQ